MNPTTSHERITVLADANVLYSNDQRNILMTFGVERVIRLRWTDEIEAEWVKNLVRNNPGVPRERVERTCRLMREAISDYAVEGHTDHLEATGSTDVKDRHVAAAAIACKPSVLVTWNIKDFDKRTLANEGVSVETPDHFLCRVFDGNPALVHAAAVDSAFDPARVAADYEMVAGAFQITAYDPATAFTNEFIDTAISYPN